MSNKIILIIGLLFIGITGFSQQIPIGSCGIVYVYDAAGNRTKRVYFCNNGSDPYPQRTSTIVDANATLEFEEVEALYPNPTTGAFSITFSKAVNNASISILDASGKILNRITAKGNRVDFDLSERAAGVYYVRIEENGKTITKKVIKL
jgi:hypothetical protein